ncbi:MAG: hypothetical protein KKE37_13245 [Verrucomicrobia bacterium]|nr:hypothetical protein [Verrucomicrobiota bacterium]MBU4291426.1 hypothetical protein [Verrucomicrobiota bacterium]MBU4430304.1 hypothetical protein [Verrucomicrobiota bacterium]MCG2679716.1 hypothetical protein [Kiritimatiellia bacterium]
MNIFLTDMRRVSNPPRVWKCLIAVGLLYAGLDLTARAGDADLDSNGNGMTVDQYEQLFGLDLRNPAVAFLDYDQDGVLNGEEWYQRTDPCRADTDDDGWPDGIDNDISRARLDFHPLFTDGDFLRYVWPSWMVAAFKAGGEWETSLPAWYVPAGTGGRLCLKVDRSILTQDLRMELEFYDAPHASLFVDLVNSRGETLVSSESVENLMDGSGEIVRKSLTVPLASYPSAVGIHLRGTGELFVFDGSLFVDQDNDGLDANQEAVMGTSDLLLDSDGDGITDYQEVFVYGTNPVVPDRVGEQAGPASSEEKDVPGRVTRPSDTPLNPAAGGTSPRAFQAARIKAITIPQWVMARLAGGQAWMGGTNFMVTRSVLGGGGTRQSGGALILEDTMAQPSAIGFSSHTDFVLHAGYQQSDEKEELLEIRNVSVTPRAYNGVNRQFNPNWGETSTFSYVISTRAETVTVGVWSEQDTNTPVITYMASGLDSGLHTFQWGGTNSSGALVTELIYYYFTISATDKKGRVVSYEPIGAQTNEIRIEVVFNIPVISQVSYAPDPFFPPRQTNEMTYNISSPGNNNHDVTVTNEDSQRNVVIAFTNLDQGRGAHLVEWGGTNSAGANMPDGIYVYRVNVVRANKKGNEKTGAVILLRENETNTVDGKVEIWHRPSEVFTIEEIPSAGLGGAAIGILVDGLVMQSPIYDIRGPDRTATDPPFILIFQYAEAIEGDIEEKLQVRRYDVVNRRWRPLESANQFIDYVNHQVIVEVWELSLLGLFTGKDTSPPLITILSPAPRTYTGETGINILYEAEDPSGVMSETVYLNGAEYPYETIAPSDLLVGENWLMVKVCDGVGNIGWASVRFLVGLLDASVRLEPETLNVNPGVLTAFVRLPEGYDPGYITNATCDGAAYESMQVNGDPSTGSGQDGTEMIIKFRRQAIEKALAEIGEEIDTSFIVRGTYTDETGTLVFEGTDEISKIVGE